MTSRTMRKPGLLDLVWMAMFTLVMVLGAAENEASACSLSGVDCEKPDQNTDDNVFGSFEHWSCVALPILAGTSTNLTRIVTQIIRASNAGFIHSPTVTITVPQRPLEILAVAPKTSPPVFITTSA